MVYFRIIFMLFSVLFVFDSCSSVEFETEEGEVNNKAHSIIRLITRAADGETIEAPLHAYAFNTEDGSLITSRLLSSEDFSLSLPQHTDIRIVILSADPESYDIPSKPSLTSYITMKDPTTVPVASPSGSIAKGYTTSPIQMGFIDVNPQSDKSTVTIQMHYQVASLSIQLQGLPQECTSAYISVASPANGLTFRGTTEGSQSTRIPLTSVPNASSSAPLATVPDGSPSGKTLSTTTPIYLFPTTAPTTFTIAYNDAEGEQYASATYQAPLKAGTPYQLNGTYSDGSFLLSGTVTPSEWVDPVVLNFTFSNDGNSTISGDGNGSDSGDVTPDIVPQILSLYDGHLVVGYLDSEGNPVEPSSSEPVQSGVKGSSLKLLLLSLTDWSNLTSALNESTPQQATEIASSYAEFNLTTGWRIPTEAESRYLSKLYRDDSDRFDQALQKGNADPIVLIDSKGSNIRYLCSEALKTYSYNASTVTNAGATVKTYHLRLVRTLNIEH